jgi:hypothetical protein
MIRLAGRVHAPRKHQFRRRTQALAGPTWEGEWSRRATAPIGRGGQHCQQHLSGLPDDRTAVSFVRVPPRQPPRLTTRTGVPTWIGKTLAMPGVRDNGPFARPPS